VALSIGSTIAERPLEARSPLPARAFEYDPFVDIFSRLDEPTDLPLFAATISGEDAEETYFVFGRLTVFDGEGFRPGVGDEATFGAGPSITQDVVIDRLGGDWLPSVSGTIAASTGEIEGGNLVGEPTAGLRYVARSTGPVIPGVREAAEVAPPHPITRAADVVDSAIAEEARRVVSEAGATTPLQKGAALETFLRGPTFSYAVNRYTSDLSDWLVDPTSEGYRSGYCEQFALSMAAMARTVGVPSRVVLGTAPGQRLADGSIVALDRYAHAWVELWIEGSGWVPFDPTPRNDGVALNPTTPRLPTEVLNAVPASEGVPEAAPLPNITVGSPSGGPQPRRWLIGLAATGAIALLAGSMLIRNRRRRAQARQGDVEAAWHEIITRLGELGAPPDPAMTPLELATSTDAAMVPLAWAYTKSTYGGGSLTVAETRRAQDSLRRTDAAVTARTARWRQISADIGLGRMATRRIRGS
jgi:transglutaminase-like putative cysteine protease